MRVTFLTLLLSGLLPLSLAWAADIQIIAHRGASHDAPENTVPAIELAWKQQADAVEIDVHLSKDGKIVVIHDADTKRTTGHEGKVAEQTLDELRGLDAGKWKDPKYAGTKIPTLEEAIAAVPEGRKLVIEVKTGTEILPELERVVHESGRMDRLAVISFSYDVAAGVKKRLPSIPSYWLYGFSEREQQHWGVSSIDELTAKAKAGGVDGLDLNYRGPVTAEFIQKAKAAGLDILVYTINQPEDARRAAAAGVLAITTDRPAFLREVLGLQ